MDKIELERLRDRLLLREKQVLRTVQSLKKEHHQLIEQRHVDWLDKSWDLSEHRLVERLSEVYLKEKEKIEIALNRLTTGNYGNCLACHQPIARARLELFPETEFCRECQGLRETLVNPP